MTPKIHTILVIIGICAAAAAALAGFYYVQLHMSAPVNPSLTPAPGTSLSEDQTADAVMSGMSEDIYSSGMSTDEVPSPETSVVSVDIAEEPPNSF